MYDFLNRGNLTPSDAMDLLGEMAGLVGGDTGVSIAAIDYGANVPSHEDYLGMTDYEIQREVDRLEAEVSMRANIDWSAPSHEALSVGLVDLAGRLNPILGAIAAVTVNETTSSTRQFISDARTVNVDESELSIRDGYAVLETRQETTQGLGFRQGHSVNPLDRAADDFDGDSNNYLQPGRSGQDTGVSIPVTTTSERGWDGSILERQWETIREQDRREDLEDAARVNADRQERGVFDLEGPEAALDGEKGAPENELDKPGPKPIILDLDGNGVSVTELAQSTHFVDGGDGLKHRTAWAAAGDGVLFYDVSGDGEISEKREYVFTDWDPSATSDLEALRSVFDTNGDGKLTAADSTFASFKVMVTKADGTIEAKTLAQLFTKKFYLWLSCSSIR